MERLLQKNPKLATAMDALIKKNITLTTAQKRNRLYFAFENRNKDWTNVVFSDEFKIGSVGIWASIDQNGPCKLRFFNGKFTSAKYVSILNDYILPLHNTNRDMILMQDKSAAHKSVLVRAWQNNHPEVNILDFPMKSFDINPMNYVWTIVKESLEYVPRNSIAMKESIVGAWHQMKDDPEYFSDIYFGMKKTMEQVIDNYGSFII